MLTSKRSRTLKRLTQFVTNALYNVTYDQGYLDATPRWINTQRERCRAYVPLNVDVSKLLLLCIHGHPSYKYTKPCWQLGTGELCPEVIEEQNVRFAADENEVMDALLSKMLCNVNGSDMEMLTRTVLQTACLSESNGLFMVTCPECLKICGSVKTHALDVESVMSRARLGTHDYVWTDRDARYVYYEHEPSAVCNTLLSCFLVHSLAHYSSAARRAFVGPHQ